MNLKTTSRAVALPPLPFPENALEPAISARTIEFHYGKHHRGYVEKLNRLIEGTDFSGMELEQIARQSHDVSGFEEIFNNAAQAWNHEFFWNSLSPAVVRPQGTLAKAIDRDFGGYDRFVEQFVRAGTRHFASGWVWLVAGNDAIWIETTPNAATPMAEGRRCLLCVDIWEHAYYLDYQNRRADFLKAVVGKLNWTFAARNLAARLIPA